MLKFPDNGTIAAFLRDFWQKEPLFLPQGIAELPRLDADEVAWLATQEEVESRLVYTEITADKASYRIEHGPFTAEQLAGLPEKNWTLLVQDVDKHLPELAQVFTEISFIPAWRIDDLMVSVAAPGGSVGPHTDNYDVFLCQQTGIRNWKVAQQSEVLQTLPHEELQLLSPFTFYDEYDAEPGDVLYLPPGTGHWGVAKTLCVTYSLGMRAPTASSLAAEFARAAAARPEIDQFYEDPDLQADESLEGEIPAAALVRARTALQAIARLDDTELATILGTMVTDPKAWLAPPLLEQHAVDLEMALFRDGKPLVMHGMARLAWSATDEILLVFANGFSCETQPTWSRLLLALSRHKSLSHSDYPELCSQPEGQRLLRWLIEKGIFDVDYGE